MKKKVFKTLITVFVVSSFIVSPVLANPSVEEIEQNKSQAEQAAGNVNEQLVALLVQFDALKKDMENQQGKIDQAAAELAAAEEKEKKQYNDMKLRIKYMYEEGDTSFLEALVSARNYADLVNKAEYVQKVHKYDRDKLEEYVDTKEQVASLKGELESGKSEMEVMARDYESQQVSLEATLTEMRNQIADFDSQLAAAQIQAAAQMQQLLADTEAVVASTSGAGNQPQGDAGAGNTPNTSQGGSTPSQTGPAPSGNQTSQGSTNSGTSQPSGGSSSSSGSSSSNSGQSSSSGSSSGSGSTSNAGKGQQIVGTACGYVGKLDYVWSGTSLVSGADCSGFTQAIFRLYGISIPRTAEAQWAGWGRTVSYSEALPGDLVCYSGHVGIYMGNGQLVHASNPTDGVKISNIGYRQWLGFKRYW